MLTYRRRKNIKKQAEVSDGEEDRLSNLPEEIITHILSFLSTMESVRTSILSTRWKYIWSFVPTLDLRYREFHSNARGHFLNVVDRMLMGHSQHFLENVYIEGLYFGLCGGDHIESWICAAIKRNVRNLQLVNFFDKQPHELHQSLFPCNNLMVLKLNLGMVLNFPMSSICFPSLKILELDSVTYKDDTSAQNLISGCPVLEDLSISIEGNDNLQTLNVMSRPLKKLGLSFTEYYELDVRKIVIDAPALEFLDIEDDVTTLEYVVRDLSSIISVKLDVSNEYFIDSDSCVTCLYEQFIKRIFYVKFLHLSSSTMLSLSFANSYDMPTFHNLTYLKFFDCNGEDCLNWKLLMEFLKNSPVLEVLIFGGFDFSLEEGGTPSEYWNVVPNCFISQLKRIEIKGRICGRDVEKVRYFLKNAKVLEKLIIKACDYEGNIAKLKMDWRDIYKHPRCSMTWSNGESVISFV